MNENRERNLGDLNKKRRMSKLSWAFTYSIIAGLFIVVIVFTLTNSVDYFIDTRVLNESEVKIVLNVDGENEIAGEQAYSEFSRVMDRYYYSENSPIDTLNETRILYKNKDPETFNFITQLMSLAKKTGGVFDPTVIPVEKADIPEEEFFEKTGYSYVYIDEDKIELNDEVSIYAKDLVPYFAMDSVNLYIENKYRNISGYIQFNEDFMVFGPKFNSSDWTIPILQPTKELTYSEDTMRLLYVPSGSVIRKAEKIVSPVDGKIVESDFYSMVSIANEALKAKCLFETLLVSPIEYITEKSERWDFEFMIMKDATDVSYSDGFNNYLINK